MSSDNMNYLALSIIVAGLLVAASMLMASNTIAGGLSKLQLAAPSGGQAQAAPQPSQAPEAAAPAPAPSPSGPEMTGLLKDAAGKMGKDNAPVLLVEFSDYQCPFCGRWYSDSEAQLKKDYIDTGKVLFAYKDFPLSFHPNAEPGAEAVRCAAEQGKFWEMHDKIFENQESMSTDNYKKWAADLKLNATQFASCFDSSKYKAAIQANETEGGQYGVNGTPSFFIGKPGQKGTLIVGAQPYSVFKQAIDQALAG